jgi:hypothetical protein
MFDQYVNPLCLSSFIFMSNSYTAYVYGYKFYSLLFVFLTVSSVINHYSTTPTKQYIDKLCVYAVVGYGLYVFLCANCSIAMQICTILLFLLTVLLYNIGEQTQTFCFDPCVETQMYYHALMHIAASFGHQLIVWNA